MRVGKGLPEQWGNLRSDGAAHCAFPSRGTSYSPTPQGRWEVKPKISRLRLEMTGVSPALQAPPPAGRRAPLGERPRGRRLSGRNHLL